MVNTKNRTSITFVKEERSRKGGRNYSKGVVGKGVTREIYAKSKKRNNVRYKSVYPGKCFIPPWKNFSMFLVTMSS